MGGKSSKDESYRQSSTSWNQQTYIQSPYYASGEAPAYTQQRYNYPPPTPNYGVHPHEQQKRFERRYSRIADNYNSLEEASVRIINTKEIDLFLQHFLNCNLCDKVTAALADAGLESSNLIVGIDFTKSNEWTGAKSFRNQSLHRISGILNPYEQAITILGKTLASFDEDNLIPCYGFGDASTHDQDVFSFYQEDRFCNGFEELLDRYKEIVPHLRLAGPTSFAPVIEMAMTIVEQSGGQYHVLVIIADGQVTRSIDTPRGYLSPQEQRTVEAIVKASKLPLSIIVVGVGDGPWETMKEFDDNIPARDFDNFQFVNFTEIMSKQLSTSRKETEFALSALMEIPSQYKATIELKLLGQTAGIVPDRVPLPPPLRSATSFSSSKPSHSTSFKKSSLSYNAYSRPAGTAPPVTTSTFDNLLCPICLSNSKDMAFGCGHQTCCYCGQDLQLCPICRSQINTRIKLY